MYEFVNGVEISGSEMDSPPVRAITELFWLIAALDNGRVSRHKEILGQRDAYNLVDVIARCENRCEQDAAQQMIAYRDRLMCLFLRLRNQLIQGAIAHLPDVAGTRHPLEHRLSWFVLVGVGPCQARGGRWRWWEVGRIAADHTEPAEACATS